MAMANATDVNVGATDFGIEAANRLIMPVDD
jgi:hypothetical protein